MSVTETLGALGSWELTLSDETPQQVLDELDYFGHVAIVNGPVDVEATGDALLTGARYVGVLRSKDRDETHRLAGSGMVFWLGDEDDKGHVIETQLDLTGMTLTAAVDAVLAACPAVTAGTIHAAAGTLPATRVQFMTPRRALQIVVDSFNREFRVNGDGTVDVGTAAELYNTEAPDSIIVRRGAGADMDLVALSGDYDVDTAVYDYSTRVVLLGQKIGEGDTADETFAVGSVSAGSVPYVDLHGNPVTLTRMISESGETAGSVAARAQLQLNRFNRVSTALKVTAEQFETEGNFVVGDNAYVYDPDTGIVNASYEVTFRGEVLHPDLIRVSGITWPVARGHTVAFRTGDGTWLDLTPFVTWETGSNEVTVGDLPKSLTSPSDTIQDRIDAGRGDPSTPSAPTGLTLTTNSTLDSKGRTVAAINVSWTAPALNTDGTTYNDHDHYQVQYRPQFRAPLWQDAPVIEGTSTVLIVPPSLAYDVRVAAKDLAGHVSAWTATSSITSAADSIAPNAPADPVVSNYLGQLRIEYAGTDSTGNPMASDTNRIDVHVGTTVGFTASTATRVDSINPFAKGVSYATAPYGSTRYVRLVAVDHDGNSSASSAVVSGATTQVVSADVFDGAIGTAKLADLAVTTAKINLLAVNDAQIGSLSVGKLTAGTISADVVNAGRFTTALTGSRREMNAIGFQAFNASEALTINLDGVNNLLTGIFKTALTGRRIEMGAGGNTGEISFLSPDGPRGRIIGYTAQAVDPGTEAIRVGVVPQSTTIWQGWGSWQSEGTAVDQSQMFAWAAYQQYIVGGNGPETSKSWRVNWATTRGSASANPTSHWRISLNETDSNIYLEPTGSGLLFRQWDSTAYSTASLRYWAKVDGSHAFYNADGDIRFNITTTDVWFQWPETNSRIVIQTPGSREDVSGELQLANGYNYISKLRFLSTSAGASSRLEFRDAGTGYSPIHAGTYSDLSRADSKSDITDFDGDALAMIRTTPVRRWRRKGATGARPKWRIETGPDGTEQRVLDGHELITGAPGEMQLGVIAEEVPEEWRTRNEDGSIVGVQYAAQIATLIGAVQQLAAELDTLKKEQL